MTARGVMVLALGMATWAMSTGCSECAGTPTCTTEPRVNATGQFIEHKTGAAVAGVHVEFVADSGVDVFDDTLRATTGADGFFTLEGVAGANGTARGTLTVTPPPPASAYAVPNVRLRVTSVRGDGTYLGRWVVDPYLIMIGEVHDASNDAVIGSATVTMERLGGGRLSEDVHTMSSDGRFGWIDPPVLEYGNIDAQFTVRLPGDSRTFINRQTVPMSTIDGTLSFVVISVNR